MDPLVQARQKQMIDAIKRDVEELNKILQRDNLSLTQIKTLADKLNRANNRAQALQGIVGLV